MSADTEVNDVRPRHSAPMQWTLLIGAHLLIRDPTTFRTNVSVHRLHGTQSIGQEPPSTDIITEGCTTVRAASAFLVFVLIRVTIYCDRVVF
jgi:hypothetical protein